jgi:hypothetical protein
MKKLPLIIVLCIFHLSLLAQNSNIIKLRSTHFCYQVKYDTYWSKWSDWEDTNILIVANIEDSRITIYSDEVQQYDIIEVVDIFTDDDGDEITKFRAVDQDGLLCEIRFVSRTDLDREEIYIDYSDMRWVYIVVGI